MCLRCSADFRERLTNGRRKAVDFGYWELCPKLRNQSRRELDACSSRLKSAPVHLPPERVLRHPESPDACRRYAQMRRDMHPSRPLALAYPEWSASAMLVRARMVLIQRTHAHRPKWLYILSKRPARTKRRFPLPMQLSANAITPFETPGKKRLTEHRQNLTTHCRSGNECGGVTPMPARR